MSHNITHNAYSIPDLVLGDTFYEWLNVTNTSVIAKLNLISAYTVTAAANQGISAYTNTNGQVDLAISNEIPQGITFLGDVRFNGTITKINSVELTVDDYNLVLGAVGEDDSGTADSAIGRCGGAGILIPRKLDSGGVGATVEWMWKGLSFGSGAVYPTTGIGASGAWFSNNYIALTGGVGLLSVDNTLRFKSGTSTIKPDGSGLMLTTASGPSSGQGPYISDSMKIAHMGTGGTGTTHGIHLDENGMVRIYDGVNKKLVTQSSHGLTFGHSVRLGTGSVGWTLAVANSKEEAEVFGIVSEVLNTSQFVVTTQGEIHGDFAAAFGLASAAAGSTLLPGGIYFLAAGTSSGMLTSVENTQAGKIRKPMVLGMGATSGFVLQYVGAKIAAESDSNAPTMRRINISTGGQLISASSGLTCDKMATGRYQITHNFGTPNYSVVASCFGTAGVAVIGATTDNNVEVCTVATAGGSADLGLNVILAKDVS
ncbi:MAG: hypothetical protein H8D80_01850 [Proteobacteria bacterium]|nr:hypothetical protein [Pseudomonadota bacterium]